MKKKFLSVMAALTLVLSLLSGCGADSSADTSGSADTGSASSQVASASEMVKPEQVVEDDMEPVPGSDVKDGVYQVTVDSSSSMFNITSCELTVQNGNMTAVMTMGGTGYLYVFMGTGEEAAQAQQSSYIPFEENEKGEHTFTVPVEALDAGIDCAAFSKNKEKWYDRTLVFRADSLPADALSNNAITTPESLNLEDGTYSIDVSLEGGSGRASVESPATLTVADGNVTAKIIWSSANYDYMKVDGTQFNCLNTEGNSTFEIPVTGFDYKMPVSADTTAMSTPHEIEYTLYFDSSTLQKK
ncbi:hypothetical protein [Butyricicoccus porcorum]|uniref:Iron transporter n=1 Tax=Butyricicoccus porcorum TaxID=1945634 RepID=A0A252F1V6_9FIRM|nr:hypothetical protein [Butyricicoccus porcorum]MDY4483188.1 hypothetical protein [Butyricicoccus porcorum]OUM19767.1 hypothetical protein CBW42_11440 [Butyricicoccus porcorum]